MLAIVLRIANDRVAMPVMALVAGLLAIAATSGSEADTTFCVFRRCTGGYCPGCGGTRAAWALLRGDFAGSWALHPWVPLLVAQLVAAAIMTMRRGIEPMRKFLVPALVANLILGLGIWILRLSTDMIPAPFG